MYSQRFVASILAGFEETLDALREGVEAEIRTELEEPVQCVESTRMRIDPDQGRSETEQTEQGLALG